MSTQAVVESTKLNDVLTQIIQSLSRADQEQVLNFARFLLWRTNQPENELIDLLDSWDDEQIAEAEVLADEAIWDQKLSSTPQTLKHLIAQAQAEIRAGQTQEMVFTEDGRIVPG